MSKADYCPVCQQERFFLVLERQLECTTCGGHIWKEPAPGEYAWENWRREREHYYARMRGRGPAMVGEGERET